MKRLLLIAPDYCHDAELRRIIDNVKSSLSSPDARIFKSDHTSTVAAVPFHDSWLVIKKYNRYARGKHFHRAFRKSRARNTWDGAHRLRAVGVDTVEPVALIEYRLGPLCMGACFIGKLLEGTDARAFFTSRDIPDYDKLESARNIIHSLRNMHASGVSHGDTKDVNILINTDGGVSWVDLDAMRLWAPGTVKKKNFRKDWMLLLYNWKNYPDILDLFIKELQPYLNAKEISILLNRLIRRQKKKQATAGPEVPQKRVAFPSGLRKTTFQAADTSGGKTTLCLYVPEHGNPVFWREIAEKYWNGALEGMQRHQSSTKARVESFMLGQTRYYFKRSFPRNNLDYVKQVFRKSRAYRDMKGTAQARSRGLHVPEVVCIVESLKWRIRRSSLSITREVPSAIQLRHLLEGYHHDGDFKSRRRLMRLLGEEMAKWLLAGMRHGDARDTNILCIMPLASLPDGNPPGNVFPSDFCWLDNERSRLVRRKNEFIRNLVQLNMTRSGLTITDRIRFWKSYWNRASRIYDPMSEKDVLHKIATWTRKRWKNRGWI